MAIPHLSVRVGKPGKAAPHAAYISREGPYAKYLSRGERLEAKGVGNMPAWANADPLAFWSAADTHERKNGTTYREMEIALPRELTPTQRKALVEEWIKQELGQKHPYQWALHNPSADGKDRPHIHLMFSERTLDDIERDPETFFRRYNPANPARGGAKKANTGKDIATRVQEMKELRARWEMACNRALEIAGRGERINMQSYASRGLNIIPERKYLPSEWRRGGKEEVREFRAAKAKVIRLREDAQLMMPLGRAQTLLISGQAKVVNIEETRGLAHVEGPRAGVSARTLGALSEAIEDFKVMTGEVTANPTKHTAFSIGELEVIERLKEAGLPPAVVAASKNNITIIFKHRPISGAERDRLTEVVYGVLGHRADQTPPTIPTDAIILEASGRTVDLGRLLGKDWMHEKGDR